MGPQTDCPLRVVEGTLNTVQQSHQQKVRYVICIAQSQVTCSPWTNHWGQRTYRRARPGSQASCWDPDHPQLTIITERAVYQLPSCSCCRQKGMDAGDKSPPQIPAVSPSRPGWGCPKLCGTRKGYIVGPSSHGRLGNRIETGS